MSDGVISKIGVAIPAHDEEALLPLCLASVAVAAAQVDIPVQVVVALDHCQDDSGSAVLAARARGLNVRAVYPAQPGVGSARAAAISALLAGADAARVWLATTDADSVVPSTWLERQLDHAADGADVVVGTVRVTDWSEHSGSVRERYLADYRSQPGHRHMHGANLSFRANRYVEAGGFRPVHADEDVHLIDRFEQLGAALVWAADVEVNTSARRVGRAPAGFAGFLLGLEEVT